VSSSLFLFFLGTSFALDAGCGDGIIGASETCDDGNTGNGDGCDSSCQIEYCGDGLMSSGSMIPTNVPSWT